MLTVKRVLVAGIVLGVLASAVWSTPVQATAYAGGALPFGSPCEKSAFEITFFGYEEDREARYAETRELVDRDRIFERSCVENAVGYGDPAAALSAAALLALAFGGMKALRARKATRA